MKPFPSQELLSWFVTSQRPLPWRKSYRPYEVWLSEVMAQQTRIDQMLPYFERFLKTFPTIESLANAPEQDVLKAWEGLGYYSRARNLQFAAKQIVSDFEGKIPQTKKELLLLKGFGPYISSAVASIAFNADEVVVDGNVLRVASRFWGDSRDVSLNTTRVAFEEKLLNELPKGHARHFNQALMELGALVCLPKNPLCDSCPLSKGCVAFATQKQSFFPVKKKKAKIPLKHFAAIRLQKGSDVVLLPRKEKLLHGMFEFPMVEYFPLQDSPRAIELRFAEKIGLTIRLKKNLMDATHTYSH
ncbi:MAG: A/G-specific adenine glycosylase, partial [archaeon]